MTESQLESEWGFSILDAIPAQIAVLDPSGNIVFVNQEWRGSARRNEAPQGCFEGANYWETCLRSAAAGDESALQVAQAIEGLTQRRIHRFDCEYPCDTPQGLLWFRMILSSMERLEGVFVVVQHIDITARVEAERRYRMVVEAVAESVIVTDSDGGILAANPAAENLFAMPRQSLLGRNLCALLGLPLPQAGLRLMCSIESVVEGEQRLNASCYAYGDPRGTHFVWTLTDVSALDRESSLKVMRIAVETEPVEELEGPLWQTLRAEYRKLLGSNQFRTNEFVEMLHRNAVNPKDFVRLHADVLYRLHKEEGGRLTGEGRMLQLRILADLGSLYLEDRGGEGF